MCSDWSWAILEQLTLNYHTNGNRHDVEKQNMVITQITYFHSFIHCNFIHKL